MLGVGEPDGVAELLVAGLLGAVTLRTPGETPLDGSLRLGETLIDSELVGLPDTDGLAVGQYVGVAVGSVLTEGEAVGHNSVGTSVGVLVGVLVGTSVGGTVTVTVGVGVGLVLSVGKGSVALGEPSFGSGLASVGVPEGSGVGLAEDVGLALGFDGLTGCG